MSNSQRKIESIDQLVADHELIGNLAGDREARRRHKLDAQKLRKLVDRLAHKRDLVRIERSIALGGQRISRQKGLIARIERMGSDSSSARELLAVLESTLALLEQKRERYLQKKRD
jgi:hypothetical protein